MPVKVNTSTPRYFNIHSHTDHSNNRFLDSINSVSDLYKNAKAKGMAGLAITDHGVVIPAAAATAQLMDKDPDFFNGKDGKGTFRPVIGSEIYLDDFNIIKDAVDHNKKTKFYHFVLTAKDDIGLHALRIISSNSWCIPLEKIDYDSKSKIDGRPKKTSESKAKMKRFLERKPYLGFFYRGMRRLPTYKDWLYKLMHDPQFNFEGHVIASTACLGSELSQSITSNNKPRAKKFIKYIEKTFGKAQCYFEMMPAHRSKQEKVNKTLWNISHGEGYFKDNTGKGIPCIISTDAHYIDHRDQQAHSIFLKSENPNRDVTDFYKYANLYTYNELKDYFPQNVLDEACSNSMKLLNRYAPIWHTTNEDKMKKLAKKDPKHPPVRLHYLQEIPRSPTPKVIPKVNLEYYAKKYNVDWNKYPYFKLMCHPESYRTKNGKKLDRRTCRADKYYMYKIFKGMKKRHIPFNNTYLRQLNREFMTLHQKTLKFHEPMSAYFLTVFYSVIDTCWAANSLIGPGRGSCAEWVSNYILGISQINSVKFHLWWKRFLCPERPDQPDIDTDSESSRRAAVIHVSREKYGIDRVLNFGTQLTQAAKSTIYSAGRGLHLSYIDQQNIANLLPADSRGMGNISLHDALFGNKKAGIQPSKPFIQAVKSHKGLESALIGIGGKIRGHGEHASGVAFFNEPLTQRNAMMRTNKAPGIPTTQADAGGSAMLSSMKYDILTLSALDRIHEALRLLLRDHKIKWLGNLHDTYLHYFGPQALDFTSKGMYEMLYKGQVPNAFEFSSLVGRKALLTMHATDFSALVASNALMRLSVDTSSNTYESKMMKKYWGSEQPIDRYVRYRDHKGDWEKDMKHFGLTKPEMAILHKFLDRHRGICYSQEDLMKLSMRICYGIKDPSAPARNENDVKGYLNANTLRKAVAKKDPKILEQARQSFYKDGKEQGFRKQFLDYVWYNCAVPAKNYSFNLAHGVAYTVILIIEMNICYRYGPIYWQTACLSVNAGMYGNNVDSFKNPNYNKLCHALSNKYIAEKLMAPDINNSSYGFVPYKNHILYGLYPIVGVNKNTAKKIIQNRPYNSFSDFLKKTKLSKKQNIQLIKAGCFDHLEPNKTRRQLMIAYVDYVIPNKKRLTTTQIPKISEFIPKKYNKMVKAYNFRSLISGRNKVPMNNDIKNTYLKDYSKKVAPYAKTGQISLLGGGTPSKSYFNKNGKFTINIKAFNKWYNQFIKPLKDWLKTPEAISDEARLRKRKLWKKYCMGNQQSWEMDSLGCYIGPHELTVTNISKKYPIATYGNLPKNPKPISKNTYKGRTYENYKNSAIYGTIIGKNANKALAYLLTPSGIANVRVGKWRYPLYNKRISPKKDPKGIGKKSWFDRGTKLLCVGHRLGQNFFLQSRGTNYPHPLYHITGYSDDAKINDVKGKPIKTRVDPTYYKRAKKIGKEKMIKQGIQKRDIEAIAIGLNMKYGSYK